MIINPESAYLVDGSLNGATKIEFVHNYKPAVIQHYIVTSGLHRQLEPQLLVKASLRQAELRASKPTKFLPVSSDGLEIPVQSGILAAHSSVFATMLSQDTDELKTGRCNIPDLLVMLHFTHSCATKVVGKLSVAVGNYDAPDLTGIWQGATFRHDQVRKCH